MINKKGKVIQIILNKDLHKYMFSVWVMEQMEKTGKDLVHIKNPEYPKGLKGYFLRFKKDSPESGFSILMDSEGIEVGDEIQVSCEKFKVECFCYIKKEEIKKC